MLEIKTPKSREQAVKICSLIWRSVDFDKWNIKDIWSIFENRVKSCAIRNTNLPDFWEMLKIKMRVQDILGRKEQRQEAAEIIEANDKAVLNELREHTSLVIMHLRIVQQEKKDLANLDEEITI